MGSCRVKQGPALLVAALALASSACEQTPYEAPEEAAASALIAARGAGGGRMLNHRELCSHENDFTLKIDNDFFPLPLGRRLVLEGSEENDEGEKVALRLVIRVLDEIEVVAGVRTRVVEEKEWEDGELVERSRNFYAQTKRGTLCYFGEDVFPASIGGEWRADDPDSHAGIFMPEEPRPGMVFFQEDAPNAADKSGILELDKRVRVPYGVFRETVVARDCNPIEDPGCSPFTSDEGKKVYAEDVGIIVDGPVRLVAFQPGRTFEDDEDDE